MLIAGKKGILGDNIRRVVQNVDDRLLSSIEHAVLGFGINEMLPGNATHIRKALLFFAASTAYNLFLQKVQSSETAGLGR